MLKWHKTFNIKELESERTRREKTIWIRIIIIKNEGEKQNRRDTEKKKWEEEQTHALISYNENGLNEQRGGCVDGFLEVNVSLIGLGNMSSVMGLLAHRGEGESQESIYRSCLHLLLSSLFCLFLALSASVSLLSISLLSASVCLSVFVHIFLYLYE